MKKFSTIIFTIFFLVMQTKMIQNIHLCGGHICSIQTFIEKEKNTCCGDLENSCCGTDEDDNSCCKDIVIEHDIDDVKIEKNQIDFCCYFTKENDLNFSFYLTKELKILKINAFDIQSNAPPLYKLFHQFIFYA